MDDNEIRNHLFQFFKDLIKNQRDTKQGYYSDYINIKYYFSCLIKEPDDKLKILIKVREILNEWVNNNILMFGFGEEHNFYHFALTEYGKKCIEEENIIPYDPQGYIEKIKEKVPDMDEVTLTYLKESVTTYNKDCLLSATVTLGAASENIILLLVDALENSLSIGEKESFQKSKENGGRPLGIFGQYKLFKEKFKELDKEKLKEVETYLESLFQFIRYNRNLAGHPTGEKVDRTTIYSNLQMFSEYSKIIFDLIKSFKKK